MTTQQNRPRTADLAERRCGVTADPTSRKGAAGSSPCGSKANPAPRAPRKPNREVVKRPRRTADLAERRCGVKNPGNSTNPTTPQPAPYYVGLTPHGVGHPYVDDPNGAK